MIYTSEKLIPIQILHIKLILIKIFQQD